MSQPNETPKQALISLLTEKPPYGDDKPDLVSADRLRRIAEAWASTGSHFSAGYVFSQAAHYAWGDVDAMFSSSIAALKEFQTAMNAPEAEPLEQVASLWMCMVEIGTSSPLFDPSQVGSVYRMLGGELAQILTRLGNDAEDLSCREGFLIRGLLLTTDLEGSWSTRFPEVEIRGTGMSGPGAGPITFTVESAFKHFIDSGDYAAADKLASQCPDAFRSHGLRGWRSAVTGLLNQDIAVDRFADAALEVSIQVCELHACSFA